MSNYVKKIIRTHDFMTFEMSDVGARTTEVRKIVVVQALLAFLYTTIAISAFVTLFTL